MYYPQRSTRFQAKKVQKVLENIQGSVHARRQIPGVTVKRLTPPLSSQLMTSVFPLFWIAPTNI